MEDGRIRSPVKVGLTHSDDAEVVDPEKNQEAINTFAKYMEEADEALEPVARQMAKFQDKKVWVKPLFTSASIVVGETEMLAKAYEANNGQPLGKGPLRPVEKYFEPLMRHAGLLRRALGPVGHIIGGLEAVVKLRNGERPETVIIEFGVSTAVAAGAAALAVVAGAGLLLGAAAVGVAVVIGQRLGDAASDQFNAAVPETPRQRIMRMSSVDMNQPGSIEL